MPRAPCCKHGRSICTERETGVVLVRLRARQRADRVRAHAAKPVVQRAQPHEYQTVSDICTDAFTHTIANGLSSEEKEAPVMQAVLGLEQRYSDRARTGILEQLQRLDARKRKAQVRCVFLPGFWALRFLDLRHARCAHFEQLCCVVAVPQCPHLYSTEPCAIPVSATDSCEHCCACRSSTGCTTRSSCTSAWPRNLPGLRATTARPTTLCSRPRS